VAELEVGVVQHELQELAVFVGKPLEDLLVLVAPLLPLLGR